MKRKIGVMLAMAVMSVAAFGVTAISVDGDVVTKDDVMKMAYKVLKSKHNINLSQSEEAEIIRNVFIDLYFWRIAATEAKNLKLNANQLLKNIHSGGFLERSEYGKLDRGAALNEATAIVIAIRLMNLNPNTIQTSDDRRNLRDQFIARYARNHRVELADYTTWRIKRQQGMPVNVSDYNALEQELDEDSSGFIKAIYYVHRYTVRYYFLFLRWYVEKATSIVDHFRRNGNDNAAVWASRILFWILPYIFHIFVYLGCLKIRHRRSKVFGVLVKAFLLMVVSVIVFFFGMSPAMLFFVFVGVPLIILLFPAVVDTMTQKKVYKKNQYGVAADRGYGYTETGELVSINENDIAYDAEYTKAGQPGVESLHNQVKE